MKYLCAIVTAILAILLGFTSKKAMSQPVSCSYGSPDNRKLCAALASLYALPNSVEAYPNPVRPNFEYLPPEYKGRINEFLENNLPGTKRQDVDHVFLRFGRRR
ncbi:UNVERIFIED_CONTAM: hypothetical protein PYX00_003687 [Menopon gallinae]|uniref:Myosuppressin n=1 Tax=Menopon gallinae TaxID=328185 RepID=A0AAW2I197_9NEOP